MGILHELLLISLIMLTFGQTTTTTATSTDCYRSTGVRADYTDDWCQANCLNEAGGVHVACLPLTNYCEPCIVETAAPLVIAECSWISTNSFAGYTDDWCASNCETAAGLHTACSPQVNYCKKQCCWESTGVRADYTDEWCDANCLNGDGLVHQACEPVSEGGDNYCQEATCIRRALAHDSNTCMYVSTGVRPDYTDDWCALNCENADGLVSQACLPEGADYCEEICCFESTGVRADYTDEWCDTNCLNEDGLVHQACQPVSEGGSDFCQEATCSRRTLQEASDCYRSTGVRSDYTDDWCQANCLNEAGGVHVACLPLTNYCEPCIVETAAPLVVAECSWISTNSFAGYTDDWCASNCETAAGLHTACSPQVNYCEKQCCWESTGVRADYTDEWCDTNCLNGDGLVHQACEPVSEGGDNYCQEATCIRRALAHASNTCTYVSTGVRPDYTDDWCAVNCENGDGLVSQACLPEGANYCEERCCFESTGVRTDYTDEWCVANCLNEDGLVHQACQPVSEGGSGFCQDAPCSRRTL